MKYRRLDNNGDMTFGNQQMDFHKNSPDGVAQAVVTRLKLWLGEWFIDMTEGTPYQQAILGKGKQESIEPALRERILETPGVTELVHFEMRHDANERTTKVVVVIDTEYGNAKIAEVL